MSTHLRILSKSHPMNTNMTGFRYLHLCALDERSLSIGRVNAAMPIVSCLVLMIKKLGTLR